MAYTPGAGGGSASCRQYGDSDDTGRQDLWGISGEYPRPAVRGGEGQGRGLPRTDAVRGRYACAEEPGAFHH